VELVVVVLVVLPVEPVVEPSVLVLPQDEGVPPLVVVDEQVAPLELDWA
jgi:hypothetical protein